MNRTRRIDPALERTWFLSQLLDQVVWRGAYELSASLAEISENRVYLSPAALRDHLLRLHRLGLVDRQQTRLSSGGLQVLWRASRPGSRKEPPQ